MKNKPDVVSDDVISLCRINVESVFKRFVRRAVLPLVKIFFGAKYLGEGFQWGVNINVKGLVAGRYSYVGPRADFVGPVVIGDLSMISADCKIVGNDHIFNDPSIPMRINHPRGARRVTVISSDVWVGYGVKIMEGVNIGRGAIVAAGAVVVKDVPSYAVVAGIPARIIKNRFNQDEINSYESLMYNFNK